MALKTTDLAQYADRGPQCFFWVPFANRFGVRVAFLISSFGAATFSIWAAVAPTFNQFIAARVLSSLFFSAPEAFGPQVVADILFLHQRATGVSIFTVLQFNGFALAGLIGAFATQNLGWRAPSWIMVILTYSIFLALLLFFPETTYTRSGRFEAGQKRRLVDNLKFWHASGGGAPKVASLWHSFRYPLLFMSHPVVLLPCIYFSLYLSCNDYMLTTNSISFPTVYNFSLTGVALTSIAPTLGNICGMFYGGLLNDKVMFSRSYYMAGDRY